MTDDVIVGGETFISSRRASESSGYAQDYIGYLARKGVIGARRIGGLWYISERSLAEYKKEAEAFKPQPPSAASRTTDPETIVSFDGREYVSATKGAGLTGYHQDYVGQLARGGKILSRQIGTRWYVDRDALLAHKREKDALLGAVQAGAVGLQRSTSMLSGADVGHDDGGPFMTYTSDTGDLIPVVAREDARNYESRGNDMPITAHISVTHPIHIRKISTTRQPQERQSRRTSVVTRVAAIAATIVIVVMVGYMSIQSNALYTSTIARETGFALAAEIATSIISRVADFVESIIAPEITYSRPN